jgi:hypothetical protein
MCKYLLKVWKLRHNFQEISCNDEIDILKKAKRERPTENSENGIVNIPIVSEKRKPPENEDNDSKERDDLEAKEPEESSKKPKLPMGFSS